MEVFKMSLTETDNIIKSLKSSRQEQVKQIRQQYKKLVEKSDQNFEKCRARIEANLTRNVQSNLSENVLSIKVTDYLAKYTEKVALIDREIQKVRAIYSNGLGTVQKKTLNQSAIFQKGDKTMGRSSKKHLHENEDEQKQKIVCAAIKIQSWWRKSRPKKKYYSKREYS